VSGSVKGVSLAAEGAAIPADHGVLLYQEDLEACPNKEVRTDQPAYASANHDCIVVTVWRLSKTLKPPGQDYSLAASMYARDNVQ
jgi:hypothetical protein